MHTQSLTTIEWPTRRKQSRWPRCWRACASTMKPPRALVDRLHPLVAQVVRANLPRRDEPEDLMQEVFLKLFSRLDQFGLAR